ncbi:Subtilisin NAT precursor [[Eubacterium] contortum]|uniref:Subtilisin NAT n=1 Tax=Faecalicatena contorta TaxID=39482 RepID=A0A174LPE5_9FIRM|nr:S8 family serine peptidase [Faecalicatena contorta]CUP23918.1 Subtilisin NAT precursor [[Eubacterium] contortum] [Faecalicatena contorta]
MSKCRKTIRGLSLVLMTAILFLSSVISVYGTDTEGSGTGGASYVPGEVLVMYREDVSEDQAEVMAEEQGDEGVELISETAEGNIAVVSVAEDSSVEEAMEVYAADDRVVAVSPNYELELFDDTTVNDSHFGRQTYLQQIRVPQAWEIVNQKEHSKVKVAVLDTGADIVHPDIENVLDLVNSREILNANGSMGPLQGDGYQNGAYSSGGGHGTHVSGIIAAQANNGEGIAGVGSALDNSVVDLMVVDVFSQDQKTSVSYVLKGLEYARNAGAKVINLSLGMRKTEIGLYDDLLSRMCRSLADEGIIIICAAGNYGTGDNGSINVIPSDYDSTISVIAVDNNMQKASSSCYGSLKDISAPGVNIWSTIKGGSYGNMNGTSMAAPEVAGVAAMMCSLNPELSVEEVRTILQDTATDIGTPGYDIYTGAGIVNAQKAVERAASIYGGEEEVPLPYNDIKKNDWFYDAAVYMYKNKIMTGLEPTVFGASEKVSRAQFATILYRASGENKIPFTARFPDVADGQFYSEAVTWAAARGIITGYENGAFGPGDLITREQMAVLLYRYVQYLGADTSNKNSLSHFPDARSVSPFAEEAMQWANAEGIITGNGDGTLAPTAFADRAACATMMMRFIKKIGI